MLHALYRVFGDRHVVLSRELTKRYEEFVRASLSEVIEQFQTLTIKGEFCVIVEGNNHVVNEKKWWEALSMIEHVNHYVTKGEIPKEAIKKVAKERGVPKREVYQQYHRL